MKIQELAIIFIIIILPISLLLSEYTQFQIQTLKIQTEYDAKLTAATYDAIKAFQLNASNSSTSDLSNSKMRDLEASVNSFRNSIISGFKLNGYTASELDNYIPALVYTLYDGFYIYSPYENTNYRYETDGNGNPIISQPIDGNGEKIYGLKPYINYSCRYINGNIDVVITYALDNYITVQGKIGDEYVNKSGYLIDNITVIGDNVTYNGVTIQNETLKEDIGGVSYNYAKINGVKYYLVGDQIVYILNGTPVTQYRDGDTNYLYWKNLILNNDSAKKCYIEANQFTTWFKSPGLINLAFKDAVDEVIDKETGATSITNIWPSNNELIFNDNSCNIENELSNFNQHRLGIIRHKIETNLAIAIANYNSYSGATTNVFQMPELKENEWDHITHNISLISFLQGLPIGGKTYNGYSLVTNSESEEVVLEQNIYILGYNTANGQYNYHKIGDKGLETGGTVAVNVGPYAKEALSAGRLNLDFERKTVVSTDNTVTYYYYPLSKYNASYDSVVMQENVTTYNDIYEYVNGQSTALKTAFYTALGRERMSKYNSNNIVSAVNVPYIPTGFTLVLGTDFDTGIVIQDRYGNQFVWVEVPKTDAVYRTAGLNITAFTNEEYNKIENDLHTYTSTYRKRTAYKDEYYSTETTGLNQTEYNTLKKNMLKNIYKYGGFYVGRYETGIANSYRTAASKSTIAEKPVIKKNAYPYNYVSTSQAQQLANSFAPTGYTSNLLFGVQYDLMLKYLENKGTTTNEIMSNSSSWGNYSNSTYRITNTTAKYYLSGIWRATPYNHSDGSKVLLTTGASEKFSRQNIFDIGGNVYEWTLEYSSYTGSPCANRGGNYMYPGSSYYAGSRGSGTITQSNELAGFRVALYKNEWGEMENYIRYYNANNLDGNGTTGIAKTKWKDMTGNYDARIHGNPTFGNGYISLNEGSSINIQYIDIGPTLNQSTMTINFKFSVSEIGARRYLMGNWEDGGFGFAIEPNGKLRFQVLTENDAGYKYAYSNTNIQTNTIYDSKAVYDGKYIYLYINGTLEAKVETGGGNIKNPLNNLNTYIGINPASGGNILDYENQYAKMKVYEVTISPFVN